MSEALTTVRGRRITNNAGLPEPLVRAIAADPYNPSSDFTVTGLIRPARIAALERQHAGEIVEDASERIWALMGQIGHLVLERAASDEYSEQRFTVSLDVGADRLYTVSGQADLWNGTDLTDYKFTSHWAAKDGLKPEWEQQLNSLAYLLAANGVIVTKADIVAIFRDWSVGEARRNRDYPQHQVAVFPCPLWPRERQSLFLKERVRAHLNARKVLPECTPLERWQRPGKWAVMHPGRKRALRLCDTKQEAEKLATGNDYVEARPAIQTRCLDYCPVSQWCKQFEQIDPDGYNAAQPPPPDPAWLAEPTESV